MFLEIIVQLQIYQKKLEENHLKDIEKMLEKKELILKKLITLILLKECQIH